MRFVALRNALVNNRTICKVLILDLVIVKNSPRLGPLRPNMGKGNDKFG